MYRSYSLTYALNKLVRGLIITYALVIFKIATTILGHIPGNYENSGSREIVRDPGIT